MTSDFDEPAKKRRRCNHKNVSDINVNIHCSNTNEISYNYSTDKHCSDLKQSVTQYGLTDTSNWNVDKNVDPIGNLSTAENDVCETKAIPNKAAIVNSLDCNSNCILDDVTREDCNLLQNNKSKPKCNNINTNTIENNNAQCQLNLQNFVLVEHDNNFGIKHKQTGDIIKFEDISLKQLSNKESFEALNTFKRQIRKILIKQGVYRVRFHLNTNMNDIDDDDECDINCDDISDGDLDSDDTESTCDDE